MSTFTYKNANNESFSKKDENIEYKGYRGMTETFREIYHALGLESVNDKRWYRKLGYLDYDLCSNTVGSAHNAMTLQQDILTTFLWRTEDFKNLFCL